MAENTTHHAIGHSINPTSDVKSSTMSASSLASSASVTPVPLIWTAKFIVIFALSLVFGLSAASIITQWWLNGLYSGAIVLMLYSVLLIVAWMTVLLRARTLWVRVGATFGVIWAILTGVSFLFEQLTVDVHLPSVAHLNAATNTALLASTICFSLAHTALRRWDNWFLRVAPVIGCVLVVVVYLLVPTQSRSFSTLESTIAAIALYLSIAIWWLRPSCWRSQPGLALLFGLASVLQLILSVPHLVDSGTNFFVVQLTLICYLLIALRIYQAEARY